MIELLIVIVIIGVLSTIATVSYRKFKTQAHMTEATAVMSAMRLAQVQYFRDTGGTFFDTSNGGIGDSWCPAGTPSDKKVAWNPDCGNTAANNVLQGQWKRLALKIDGPVYFQYVAVAGPRSNMASLSVAGTFVGMSSMNGVSQNLAAAPAGPFFLIAGQADPHKLGTMTKALTHSSTGAVSIEEHY